MMTAVGFELLSETVIEEEDLWIVAVNRNQDLLGKSMVVLRRDCTAVVDVTQSEWLALRSVLRRLVPALEALFEPDQMNFAFLMNLDAQVHLHVIPRYAGPRYWRGIKFEDPHWGSAFGHEQRIIDTGTLAALAKEIRQALHAG